MTRNAQQRRRHRRHSALYVATTYMLAWIMTVSPALSGYSTAVSSGSLAYAAEPESQTQALDSSTAGEDTGATQTMGQSSGESQSEQAARSGEAGQHEQESQSSEATESGEAAQQEAQSEGQSEGQAQSGDEAQSEGQMQPE